MQYINTWFQNKLSICLLITGILTLSHAAQAKLSEGDQLPDLASLGIEGDLPSIEGKVVLLDFWASWCAPCKASFPVMDKIYAQFKDQGFEIIAVSVDKKSKKYKKFADKSDVSFPMVHDASKQLVKLAEIESMPTSFLIDKNGTIVAVHKGFHGKKTEEQYISEIQKLLAE